MILYFSILFSLLLLSNLKRQNKTFVLIIIFFILFYGLRGETMGKDTMMYNMLYEEQKYGEISDHLELIYQILFQTLYTMNVPIWLMQCCCGALTFIPLAIVIKRSKVNPILALFFYYALYYYLNSFNISRQLMAVSYVMLAYSYYPRKLPTIICILIGFGMHSSALLGFLIFLTPYIKIRSTTIYAILIATFIFGYFLDDSWLTLILGRYNAYFTDKTLSSSFGYRDNVLYASVMAAALNIIFLVVNQSATSDLKKSKWFKLFLFMVLIDNMTYKLVLGARVILYFTIVQIIVYPLVFRYNRERKPIILKAIILAYSFVYFVKLMVNTQETYVPYTSIFN